MLVKIDIEEVTRIVSDELQRFYHDVKSDEDFEFTAGTSREDILKSLIDIIEYYTSPSEFDAWMKHDA